MENKKHNENMNKELPTSRVEDVEFSMDLADAEDMEALERAEQADRRQEEQ